jgi:uncharacterized membrane protein YkvA (DUF1232 family)
MKFSISSIYDWYRQAIRHPKYGWWVGIGTLIYLISPFDISPDFIPIVGEIDDVVLVGLLVAEVSQIILEKYKSRKQGSTVSQEAVSNQTIEVEAVDTEPVSTNKS